MVLSAEQRNPEFDQATSEQRRGQRLAILTQCIGVLPLLAYQNGLLLAFLARLGLGNDLVLFLLGLPAIINAALIMPLAHLGDRYGIHRIGQLGIIGSASSFVLLILASCYDDLLLRGLLLAAFACHGFAQSLFMSGWFALLRPLVPSQERGRFFGRLRMSWQLVGIVIGLGLAWLLRGEAGLGLYRLILAVIVFCQLLRLFTYRRIPVLVEWSTTQEGLLRIVRRLIAQPDYLAFGSYLFLLHSCIGACVWIFGLLQKRTLGFSDGALLLMGILGAIGSMGGFFLGGRLVDRYGCRSVFFGAHIGFAVLLVVILLRDLQPTSMHQFFSLVSMLWGAVLGASGIALTSEMMAVAPRHNQALAIAGLSMMQISGFALSAFLASRLIALGLFAETWTFLGCQLGPFDALLVLLALALAVISITLGLVPSVVRKSAALPQPN